MGYRSGTDSSWRMLQDEDVTEELQQCGMDMSDSRAANLATLWQIIEDHQPSSPPEQLPSLSPRCASWTLAGTP